MRCLVLLLASLIPLAANAQRFQDLCEPLDGSARIKCIELQQQQAQQRLQLEFEKKKQHEAQKKRAVQDSQKTAEGQKR